MNENFCQPQAIETESAIATVHKQVVIVQSHVWKKIHGWCKAAKSEVSGLGLVRLTSKGMEVYDVFLPKQKCSSGYTELDDLATPKLITRLHKTKRRTEDLRFWWHTHYNFGVFWSSTDDNNAREMVETNGDWLLSVVVNQRGEYRCRVDTVKPVRSTIDKITVYIGKDDKATDSRKRNFKTDIKKYVRPMTYGGPNESGIVSYVGGQTYSSPASRWGDDKKDNLYDGYSEYGNYWDGTKYTESSTVDKNSESSKPIKDWWDRYEDKMKEKGFTVKRPAWVKPKEEKKSTPALSTLAQRINESKRYQMEDGEEIDLDGQAYIYHGGMFLSEDQYLWALESGKVPDNPVDKNECDEWIKLNSVRGLIS